MKLSLALPNTVTFRQLLAKQRIFATLEHVDILGHSIISIEIDLEKCLADSEQIEKCYLILYSILEQLIKNFSQSIKDKNIIAFADASAELTAFVVFIEDLLEETPYQQDSKFSSFDFNKFSKLTKIEEMDRMFCIFPHESVSLSQLDAKQDMQSFDSFYEQLTSKISTMDDTTSSRGERALEILQNSQRIPFLFVEYLDGKKKSLNSNSDKFSDGTSSTADSLSTIDSSILSEDNFKKIITEQTPVYNRLNSLDTSEALKFTIKQLILPNSSDKFLFLLMDVYEYKKNIDANSIKFKDSFEKTQLSLLCSALSQAIETTKLDTSSNLSQQYRKEIQESLTFINQIVRKDDELKPIHLSSNEQQSFEKMKLSMKNAFQAKIASLATLNNGVIAYKNTCEITKPREKIATQEELAPKKTEIASTLNAQLERTDISVKQKVLEIGAIIRDNTTEIQSSGQPKTIVNSFWRCCIKVCSAAQALGYHIVGNELMRDAYLARMKDTANCAHGAKLINHFDHHIKELGINTPSFRA